MDPGQRLHVAYRAVLLAAGLVVLGLVFRQVLALLAAVMITVIWALPLSALATRLERRGVPRTIGALAGLLAVGGVLAAILALVIPSFVREVDQLVNAVPGIADDLGRRLHETTGASSAEIGQRIQAFLRRYAGQPLRLLGPLASIGAGVASVLGALILMVITAYYIAIRPEPLLESILRVFPVDRRGRALEVMQRLRTAWLGWLQGVALDMVISGTMLYVGLRLVGLDFAVVFAVLTGLLVVVPYFGAIAGAIPPVLLALTESPGRALVVLGIYVLVQEVEGHLVIPLVMSRTVNLHPAAIAIGVVLVGAVFGLPGLFVAVPIISTVTILTEELWVRPLERAPYGTLDRVPSDEPPAAVDKAPRRVARPGRRQSGVRSSAR